MRTPRSIQRYSDLTNLYGPYGRHGVITSRGTLVMGLRLGGVDNSTLTINDMRALTQIFRNVMTTLPDNLILTSYKITTKAPPLHYKTAEHPVSRYVVEKRERFINDDLNLSRTQLYFMLEIEPDLGFYHRPGFLTLLNLMVKSPFSSRARAQLKANYLDEQAIVFYRDAMDELLDQLEVSVQQLQTRFQMVMGCDVLGHQDIWRLARFLTTYDTEHLYGGDPVVPDNNWQDLLADGDARVVDAENMPLLLVRNRQDTWARFGSLKNWIEDDIKPGAFFFGDYAPLARNDNHVYMCRFRPLSAWARGRFFRGRKDELVRQNITLEEMLTGRGVREDKIIRPTQKKQLEELDEASGLPERWGYFSASFCLLGTPKTIRKSSASLQSQFEAAGAGVLWEGDAIPLIYRSMQPGVPDYHVREHPFNMTQFAACFAAYGENEGKWECEDIRQEHLFTFTTRGKTPYYFSQWLGGSGAVIGVGPIRSGKSFIKNTLATHFGKYAGSIYRAIDIDPGTEPIAQLFGDDGRIFSIDLAGGRGLNPFAMLNGRNEALVAAHIKDMVVSMLSYNNAIEAQTMSASEEKNLQYCIGQLVRMSDPRFRHFPALFAMLEPALKEKLASFYDSGIYAALFTEDDAIGHSDARMGVYNLAGIRDILPYKELAMKEIFWRTSLLFEDPAWRSVPKLLDIDEAHAILKTRMDAENVIRYIRTGGKHLMGITLWSQSPQEFLSIDDWPALRSAAATLFFTADAALDASLYKDAFELTPGEIQMISELQPQREALIVQRRSGVSKVVQLIVDDEQYALCTSSPLEAARRAALIEQYGFKKGIDLFIRELSETRSSLVNPTKMEAA